MKNQSLRESATPIIISGIAGRMGSLICKLALADPEVTLIGGIDRRGQSVGGVPVKSDLSSLAPAAGTVLIDFTEPSATRQYLEQALSRNFKLVIGTTGLDAPTLERIRECSSQIPIVVSSNMSPGINALLGLTEKLSATLPDYDIEIIEMHHRHKKDAPSGTAIALGEAAARGRGQQLPDVQRHGRTGITDERTASEIGIHAVRAGEVVGEHTVIFASAHERIELAHRAQSREVFAAGALRAAKFLRDKQSGLFSMRDVLGFG